MEPKFMSKSERQTRDDDKMEENTLITILKKALLNIKGMLALLGEDLLSPDILEWLKGLIDKSIETIDEFEIETFSGTIVLGKGKVKVGDSKAKKVKAAVTVDNVRIVIHEGAKGKGQGVTYAPKKKRDPIVILLDESDVGDQLRMKIVLFHELVHEKQLRDPNSGFAEIRDGDEGDAEKIKKIEELAPNFEAEAHLATVFISTLLLQQHPEGEKAILEKFDNALKRLKSFLDKANDPLKLMNQILATKDKLRREIGEENKALKEKIKELNTLRNQLQKELERYKKSLPKTKETDKIAKRLDKLAQKIKDAGAAISDFETIKAALLESDARLAKKLEEIAGKFAERQKKAMQLEKEEDKERRKTLKKEIKELNKELKELSSEIKKGIDDEVKDLKKIDKKARTTQTTIKELIEEIAKELGESLDDGLINLFTKLLGCLRKTANVLSKLKFKLNVLKELEVLVKKLIA
jgi:hypothetical protein